MTNDKPTSPAPVLGEDILRMGRRELCELVIALCGQIQEQVGTDRYRGGVYPGNIRLTEEGPVLGPGSASDWQGEELQFLAPELYWNGERTPAADVYSLGLLLYYAVDSGRLPFARDGEEKAARRRLNGEFFPAPRAAGRRLGEIIMKATAFRRAERYQTVAELKAVLLSCVQTYLGGAPSAEALFQKNEAELSQVERMMVSILRRDAQPPEEETKQKDGDETVNEDEKNEKTIEPAAPEETPAEETPVEEAQEDPDADVKIAGEEPEAAPEESAPEESEQDDPDADMKIAPGAPGTAPEPETPPEPEKPREPIPILEVEHNPELEPVVIDWPAAEIRYGTNVERERKIAETVRRRRRRPVLAVVILCALLLGAAVVYNAISRHNDPTRSAPAEPTPPAVTADTETAAPVETAPAETPSAEPVETPKPESSYRLFIEDVSWTEARDRCAEMGGYLVVINDKDEFDKVVALAETYGMGMVWIGCQRTQGELRWVNGEQVGFWPWGDGEPSYTDDYDDAAEDYIMLWDVVGYWCYNDSRNDPIDTYPRAYSGNIAFICEFEG